MDLNTHTRDNPSPFVGELQHFLSAYPTLADTQPAEGCLIDATNDVEAIECWLYAYREKSLHTQAAFRKDAVRYLLWLQLARRECLADAVVSQIIPPPISQVNSPRL